MSTEGSSKAIIAALSANLGIAVAKFAGFLITGSSSMLAESVHSIADSGNQGLLILGRRKARQAPDEQHQFGYGTYRYFYAFVVALVIFVLGSVFALYEGIHKLGHPEALSAPVVALVILLLAIGLEGYSLLTAIGESNKIRGSRSWWGFIRSARTPELPVVLLEDTGALLGLLFALFGIAMTMITGNARWDAVGSIAIGVLLGAIAVVLIVETRSLLIGEGAIAEDQERIRDQLAPEAGDGVIQGVIHMRTQHLSPEDLLVAAKVAIAPGATMAQLTAAIDAAEVRIRAAVPAAALVYLEPDIRIPGSPHLEGPPPLRPDQPADLPDDLVEDIHG